MTAEPNEYCVRTFRKGDEIELVNLFNRIYEDFAGFVPRTPEYWGWCCLSRPDVNEESIAIVNKKQEIVGYAVVGKLGDVLEFCYDPDYDGKIIVSKLLNWALSYVEKSGSDHVLLNAPVEDDVIREVCQEMDFAETMPEPMFVSVLDFSKLICEILSSRKETSNIDGTFSFRLKGCPSWSNDRFCMHFTGNETCAKEEMVDTPEIMVDADMCTLVSCILGTRSILKAIITSKIRVRPFWKVRKLLRLLSLVRVRDPWFCPRADYG